MQPCRYMHAAIQAKLKSSTSLWGTSASTGTILLQKNGGGGGSVLGANLGVGFVTADL
jgi:hypothetical protein